jgi:hypothetical protein
MRKSVPTIPIEVANVKRTASDVNVVIEVGERTARAWRLLRASLNVHLGPVVVPPTGPGPCQNRAVILV